MQACCAQAQLFGMLTTLSNKVVHAGFRLQLHAESRRQSEDNEEDHRMLHAAQKAWCMAMYGSEEIPMSQQTQVPHTQHTYPNHVAQGCSSPHECLTMCPPQLEAHWQAGWYGVALCQAAAQWGSEARQNVLRHLCPGVHLHSNCWNPHCALSVSASQLFRSLPQTNTRAGHVRANPRAPALFCLNKLVLP